MAGLTVLCFEQEFFWTQNNVRGHQLGPFVRQIEDLATHAAITVIEDDQSPMQHPAAGVTAEVGLLPVRRSCLISRCHRMDLLSLRSDYECNNK
jgi:hypothetical protein